MDTTGVHLKYTFRSRRNKKDACVRTDGDGKNLPDAVGVRAVASEIRVVASFEHPKEVGKGEDGQKERPAERGHVAREESLENVGGRLLTLSLGPYTSCILTQLDVHSLET